MKNILCILSFILIISACSEYEEGPSMSLYTRKYRIANNWQLEEIENTYSGESWDTSLSRMIWTFEDNGDFWKSDNTEGIWEFQGDVDLKLTFDTHVDGEFDKFDSSKVFTISRLKKKELWLREPYPNDQLRYHYIPVGN